MRVLLDTHALLWWFTDDDQLSVAAREVIADGSNDVLVSAASAGEIATKQRLGRLCDVPQAAERFSALVDADGFTHLSIDHLHSLRAGSYRVGHRDPFDRILAVQSELELLTLVTRDGVFEQFDVATLW